MVGKKQIFTRIYNILISFFSFCKDFKDKIQSIEGVTLRGYTKYVIWDE
jgi:hypothetical protein